MEILAITTASVLSMFMNMTAVNNNSNHFLYNADMENGTVNTIYAYNREQGGKVLSAKTKYDYSYDGMNRVQTKTKYVFVGGKWKLDSKVNFTYEPDQTTVDFQAWNGKGFDEVSERTVYKTLGNDVLGINQYKWFTTGIKLIDSYMIIHSDMEALLAQTLR
jgi:hypothetical protein